MEDVVQAPFGAAPPPPHIVTGAPDAIAPAEFGAPEAISTEMMPQPVPFGAPEAIAPAEFGAPEAIAPAEFGAPEAIAPAEFGAPEAIAPAEFGAPEAISTEMMPMPVPFGAPEAIAAEMTPPVTFGALFVKEPVGQQEYAAYYMEARGESGNVRVAEMLSRFHEVSQNVENLIGDCFRTNMQDQRLIHQLFDAVNETTLLLKPMGYLAFKSGTGISEDIKKDCLDLYRDGMQKKYDMIRNKSVRPLIQYAKDHMGLISL